MKRCPGQSRALCCQSCAFQPPTNPDHQQVLSCRPCVYFPSGLFIKINAQDRALLCVVRSTIVKVSERSQGSQITLAARSDVVLLCYQQETSLPAQELQLCNWPGARTWQRFLILSGLGYFGSWYIRRTAHSVSWTLGTGSCEKSVCFAILVVAIVAAWMIFFWPAAIRGGFLIVHMYTFIIWAQMDVLKVINMVMQVL